MSALEQSKFSMRVTFQGLLKQEPEEKKVEDMLIDKLSKYSSSSFSDDSWIIDKATDKAHGDRVTFHMFKEMGVRAVSLIKLFAIVLFERGSSRVHIRHLNIYIKFLSEENIRLLQVNKKTFSYYSNWLDSKKKEDGEDYASVYKNKLLDSALMFHTYMNTHSSLAYIKGVESIENHYNKNSDSSDSDRYKVINDNVLEKLDTHFMSEEPPLHIRGAYWIMRMYATRPMDTLNYPLDCVKKLSKDMGTIKHAIVKNSKSARGIDYKIEYLNLKEPMQKMLYKLIKRQQKASQEIQEVSNKKNFLFTYRHGQSKNSQYLSNQVLSRYFRKLQKELNIPETDFAVPRDLKKTGITMRLEAGWSTPQLKNFANHRTYESIDSYTSPSESFMIEEQRKILLVKKETISRYMAKGRIINGIDDAFEKKLLENPKAHKISDLGYCPNTAGCGNHYECLDCDDLVPDKELEEYYLEQVDRYLKITEKQYENGDSINAKDSHHRASLFASLYNKLDSNRSTK